MKKSTLLPLLSIVVLLSGCADRNDLNVRNNEANQVEQVTQEETQEANEPEDILDENDSDDRGSLSILDQAKLKLEQDKMKELSGGLIFSLKEEVKGFEGYDHTPNEYEIAVILEVLKETPESNSHQMGGQTDNVTYHHVDGHQEAVFDGNGDIVTNCLNAGRYNFFNRKEAPIEYFQIDILPWMFYGSCKIDDFSFKERAHYYTLDLDAGIQQLFKIDVEDLQQDQSFEDFDEQQQETILFFHYLLFNNGHQEYASPEHFEIMLKDAEVYYTYFYYIQELFGVEE